MEGLNDFWKNAGEKSEEITEVYDFPTAGNDMELLLNRLKKHRALSVAGSVFFLLFWVVGFTDPVHRISMGLVVLLFGIPSVLWAVRLGDTIVPRFDDQPLQTVRKLISVSESLKKAQKRWIQWSLPGLVLGGFVTGLNLGISDFGKLVGTPVIVGLIVGTYLLLLFTAYLVVNIVLNRREDSLLERLKKVADDLEKIYN